MAPGELRRAGAAIDHDPVAAAARLAELDGLSALRAIMAGELPPAPIGVLLGFEPLEVEDGRGARAGGRPAAGPRHRRRSHHDIGRSKSVDSTTCVWVRMIPGASRMRSSASSRCVVSCAWTCRIALASPATV